MVEDALTHLGGCFPPSSPIDIKALSAEQTRINRPRPRPEHRHTHGQYQEKDVNQRTLVRRTMERQHLPSLQQSNRSCDDWRPQARKQTDAAGQRKQILCESD